MNQGQRPRGRCGKQPIRGHHSYANDAAIDVEERTPRCQRTMRRRGQAVLDVERLIRMLRREGGRGNRRRVATRRAGAHDQDRLPDSHVGHERRNIGGRGRHGQQREACLGGLGEDLSKQVLAAWQSNPNWAHAIQHAFAGQDQPVGRDDQTRPGEWPAFDVDQPGGGVTCGLSVDNDGVVDRLKRGAGLRDCDGLERREWQDHLGRGFGCRRGRWS